MKQHKTEIERKEIESSAARNILLAQNKTSKQKKAENSQGKNKEGGGYNPSTNNNKQPSRIIPSTLNTFVNNTQGSSTNASLPKNKSIDEEYNEIIKAENPMVLVVSPNQSYDSNKISQTLQEHFEQKQKTCSLIFDSAGTRIYNASNDEYEAINEFNSVKSDVDSFKAETSSYFAEHPSRPNGKPRLPDTLILKIKKQTEKMLMDVLTEKIDARISILETGLTKLVVELREEVVVLRKEVEGLTNKNLLLTNFTVEQTNLIQQLTTKAVEQTNLIQQLNTKAVEQTNLIVEQTNRIQQLTKKLDEQATTHEKEKILRDEQYKNLEERISRMMMTTCNFGCSNCLKCVNKQ